jgi:hypothetical protein
LVAEKKMKKKVSYIFKKFPLSKHREEKQQFKNVDFISTLDPAEPIDPRHIYFIFLKREREYLCMTR